MIVGSSSWHAGFEGIAHCGKAVEDVKYEKTPDHWWRTPVIVGIGADLGGFELKTHLVERLRRDGHEVIHYGYGAMALQPEDDYPDVVIPLAWAVAEGKPERGIAVCGSGVGAAIAANKIHVVQAAMVQEIYSARQGVEHDDMNVRCLGGRVLGDALEWELVCAFLSAQFNGSERHRRRLEKICALE
jgi:ribose 5-phosphate isomerase B